MGDQDTNKERGSDGMHAAINKLLRSILVMIPTEHLNRIVLVAVPTVSWKVAKFYPIQKGGP